MPEPRRSQKGTLGGAPWASSTSTRPDLPSTRRIRQELLPSSMMSPALLSTAKSSSSVPITVPSGSATTVNKAVSGMAPPLVIAASRRAAPRSQLAIDAIAMYVSAVASAPRRNALGQHFENGVVGFTRKIAIRIRAPNQGEQFVFVPTRIVWRGRPVRVSEAAELVLRRGGSCRPPRSGRECPLYTSHRRTRRLPRSAAPECPAASPGS